MLIISHLMGGLGNQMFQYAVAKGIQTKAGGRDNLRVFFEDGYRLATRSYALDRFRITGKLATHKELTEVGPERRLRRRMKMLLKRPIDKNVVREKKNFVFDPSVLERTADTYLIGFWQSYKYFDFIREQLLKEFVPRTVSDELKTAAQSITSVTSSVSVHIRRSDYLQVASGFAPLSLEYYKRAFGVIKEKTKSFEVFIFSDDVAWAETNIREIVGAASINVVSDQKLKDYEEMILMGLCDHHIIANSSFSWWGAWLDQKPGKIVIAPRTWNGTDESIPVTDLIPPSWTLV